MFFTRGKSIARINRTLGFIFLFLGAYWAEGLLFAASSTTVPSSDGGTVGTWTPSSGGTLWNMVSEFPTPDEDTSTVFTAAVGTVTFNFSPFNLDTDNTIDSVAVTWRVKKVGGINGTKGALVVNVSTYMPAPANGPLISYSNFTSTWTTNPATSLAWTVADVNDTNGNGLKRMGFSVSLGGNDTFTQTYLMVNYTADASSPAAITGLVAQPGGSSGHISLQWIAPGDNVNTKNIDNGLFRIFGSTNSSDMTGLTAQSSTSSSLSMIEISTSGVVPGTTRYTTLSGLVDNATYYIRVFAADEVPNWSGLSNGATTYATGAGGGGAGPISSAGTGNWHSTTPNAPWPSGVIPVYTDTVTIAAGHVITATAPITVTSITINASGELDLHASTQAVTLTIQNGGKLVNNGIMKVSSANFNVTLQGESGGSMTFEGTDIDYNGRKIFLGRVWYTPTLSLGSGETIELSGSTTFYAFTTLSGSSFIQGATPDVYFASHTTLASGTFTKSTGSGKVYFAGDSLLNSGGQNLGDVTIGHSPDCITLLNPLIVDRLRINRNDTLVTQGYPVKVLVRFENKGILFNQPSKFSCSP